MLSNQENTTRQSDVQYMYNISFITFKLSWELWAILSISLYFMSYFSLISVASQGLPLFLLISNLLIEDYAYFVVGPAFIDFNDVCMRSINTKHINIVNNLESHIHVQVTVSCIIILWMGLWMKAWTGNYEKNCRQLYGARSCLSLDIKRTTTK